MRKILKPHTHTHPQPGGAPLVAAQSEPREPEKPDNNNNNNNNGGVQPTSSLSSQQSAAERQAKLKAEARAYALSVPTREGKQYRSSSGSGGGKNSSSSTSTSTSTTKNSSKSNPNNKRKAQQSPAPRLSARSRTTAASKTKATSKSKAASKATSKAASRGKTAPASVAPVRKRARLATTTTTTTTAAQSKTATASLSSSSSSSFAPQTQPIHWANAPAAAAPYAALQPGVRVPTGRMVQQPLYTQQQQQQQPPYTNTRQPPSTQHPPYIQQPPYNNIQQPHTKQPPLSLPLSLPLPYTRNHRPAAPPRSSQLSAGRAAVAGAVAVAVAPLPIARPKATATSTSTYTIAASTSTSTSLATTAGVTPSAAAAATASAPATAAAAAAAAALDQTRYDPEYLKMIQSLGELDDFSIWDNLSDVEDVDFRLSDLEDDDDYDDEDDDDDDEDNDDNNDEDRVTGLHLLKDKDKDMNRANAKPPGPTTTVTPVVGTGNEGPVSVTAPSSPNTSAATATTTATATATVTAAPNGSSSAGTSATVLPAATPLATTTALSDPLSLSSPLENSNSNSNSSDDLLYRNLEEELGSLLEEDLEAAVQSLYNTTNAASASASATASDDPKNKKKGGSGSKTGKASPSKQQRSPLHPQHHPPTAFSAANANHRGPNTPVTAAVLAAEAKRKAEAEAAAKAKNSKNKNNNTASTNNNNNNNPAPDTPLRETAKHSGTAVTYQQSQQLRTLLRKHYQLLTQQAILSVRAAQQLKTGSSCISHGHGIDVNGTGIGTGIPGAAAPGIRPLTPDGPTSASIAASSGDFLSGENETDLTEILDLAVGMLQDLDQNRKDSIRTSIQLALTSNGNDNGSSNGSSNANGNANGGRNHSKDHGGSTVSSVLDRGTTTTRCDGGNASGTGARRSLLSQFDEGHNRKNNKKDNKDNAKTAANVLLANESTPRSTSNQGGGRLTRAAFRRLQAQPIAGSKRTAFDIPGLLKLNETFATIDDSVNVNHNQNYGASKNALKNGAPAPAATATTTTANHGTTKKKKTVNILEADTHAQACRDVLKDAGAHVEEQLLPGVLDLSENFSQLQEHLGEDFRPPCSPEQERFLRKNRNLFTSGEDNLVLRGVNLYGEKQWILIGDRYLPDRSINIISQRYSKLCVMLYKAHGICVDPKGNLLEPPKLESVDDIDEARVEAAGLKLVEPPAILNVHRWSMEEDLTILKAVPIMGHMWAELGARLIPHRDRGHLRKRYQVLERRVKATITRGFKAAEKARNAASASSKTSSRSTYRAGIGKAKGKIAAKASAGKIAAKPTVGAIAVATKPALAPKAAKPAASPDRAVKKAPSSARSPAKSKTAGTTGTNTKPSPGKRKSTMASDAGSSEKNPVMSLESAAASLACMQGKNVPSIARGGTDAEPPAKSAAPKRATLQQVAPVPAAGPNNLAPSNLAGKPMPYHHPEGHPPPPSDAGMVKYGPPPHPPAGSQPVPPGAKNAPSHHPLYPYQYYPGYYHPHYAYPPKGHHPSSTNTPTPPPHLVGPKNNIPKPSVSAEGKQYNLASPKLTAASTAAASRPPTELNTTPTTKSLMAGIVPNLEAYSVSADGDTSRLEFEKLIEGIGGGNEDTQMSKLKKMMENEDESEAANAIVSHLARSPGRKPAERSGLSIMARVLKGSSASSSSSFSSSILAGAATTALPPKPLPAPDAAKAFAIASPTKKRTGSLLRHGSVSSSATVAPSTPQRRKNTITNSFYSTSNGTPLGLSPGLRSLGASALLKNDVVGSTSLTAPFSPAPNDGSLLSKEDGLRTNLSVPYSPAPSMLFRAFDEKTGDENRFGLVDDTDPRVCEDSNQLGDLAVGADLSDGAAVGNGTSVSGNHHPPAGNSLLIAPDEFDAISGLGALSNSPFKAVNNDKATKPKKAHQSFFARVVGESKETSPQKKLF